MLRVGWLRDFQAVTQRFLGTNERCGCAIGAIAHHPNVVVIYGRFDGKFRGATAIFHYLMATLVYSV